MLPCAALSSRISVACWVCNYQNVIASWRYNALENDDKLGDFISHWLFPFPVAQPVWHSGEIIGEVRLTARIEEFVINIA
ncbi:CHASE sensor domain-containing protein [Citrobacter amalonaticus]|uniref:CHASE sensor domain-containing protein n=1 Tax=Citrobacter amalonaticus TaxID=35703 RepID=UPI0006D59E88